MLMFRFDHDDLDGDLLIVSGVAWVAEILGRDRKYRYERRFIKSREQLDNHRDDCSPVGGCFCQPLGFRIVLQDCSPPPIFLQCAEDRTVRTFWKVERLGTGAEWSMVSEKEMRRVLAQGRSVPKRAQVEPCAPVSRKFHLPREA